MIVSNLEIVSNFTRLTVREITYKNFEISLVVFKPKITYKSRYPVVPENIRPPPWRELEFQEGGGGGSEAQEIPGGEEGVGQ